MWRLFAILGIGMPSSASAASIMSCPSSTRVTSSLVAVCIGSEIFDFGHEAPHLLSDVDCEPVRK